MLPSEVPESESIGSIPPQYLPAIGLPLAPFLGNSNISIAPSKLVPGV